MGTDEKKKETKSLNKIISDKNNALKEKKKSLSTLTSADQEHEHWNVPWMPKKCLVNETWEFVTVANWTSRDFPTSLR